MKNTFAFLATAAGGALFIGMVGCTTMNTVEPAQSVAQRQMLSDKRVITDTGLHNRAQVVGINTATGPGGFLKIQVEIQNTTSRHHTFTYRIEWFDENGMLIATPAAAAISRSIEGGEILAITATAPTDSAKDFRIKLLDPVN